MHICKGSPFFLFFFLFEPRLCSYVMQFIYKDQFFISAGIHYKDTRAGDFRQKCKSDPDFDHDLIRRIQFF